MKHLSILLLATLLSVLASCASGSGQSTDSLTAALPELNAVLATKELPNPADLDAQARAASIAGPGWQPLDLSAPPVSGLSANAASGGGAIDFSSISGLAWQVFGVGDFREDFQPTSLAADVVENDVPYYLGHVDYTSGRWVLAGPFLGDVVHQYAGVDDHSDPSAFISPFGLHYVAIVVPEAAFLQLDGLSVGILSGDEAPLPVVEYQQNGGMDAIYFQWLDSPSALDADFDGYIVQRSPYLTMNWKDLIDEPQRIRSYADRDAQPATLYRYRVNTYDLAGNVGYGIPFVMQTTAGNSPPMAVVDVPRGPHFGPVELRFDMSGSFDPEDDPITGYSFDFGPGPAVVTQPGPVLDFTLQPGNYIVGCTASGTGGSTTDYVPLVVYPRWQDGSTLVEDGSPDFQRCFFPWTISETDGSATTNFYFDVGIPGITALTVDSAGVARSSYNSSVFDETQIISEPVPYDEGWAFAVYANGVALIYVWDGDRLEQLTDFNFRVDSSDCQLVTDGASGLYFIYYRNDGPSNWAMVWRDLVSSAEIDLKTGLSSPLDFDCDWNQQAGAFDAVYVDGDLFWARFLPSTPIASATISLDAPTSLEMDIDPATGRPAVAYFFADKVRYSALNADLATWTVPEPVETTANHGQQPQLVHDGGKAYVAISIPSSGKVQVLENDGSGWTSWNVHDDADLGDSINLAKLPGEEGLRILTQHNDNSTRIFRLRADDSQELLVKVAGIWGAGYDLTAASDASGLHLMQRDDFGTLHLFSTDGLAWTSEAVPAGTIVSFELGGSDTGVMHLSWTNGTDVHLDKWDGAAFVNITSGSIPSGRRPILSDEGPYRNAWEDIGGSDFQIYQQATTLISHSMAGMPIWDGSLLGSTIVSRPLVFYGGLDLEDANIGFADIATNKIEPVAHVDAGTMSLNWLEGRGMAGASFTHPQLLAEVQAWHVSAGPDIRPLRVVRNPDGSFETESMLEFSGIGFAYPDVRRSSSARQAWGGTFVGLTAANLLSEHRFEWSRFGEWEDLPLPEVENMSLPELLVGPDGRWHIIYRDYVNDDLRIISTVE
ncbi:hypothetical protein KDL29_02685 [bacterium]|nr:hypothetical protein [bacterium]